MTAPEPGAPGLRLGRFLGVPVVLGRPAAGGLAAVTLGGALACGPAAAPVLTAGLAGILLVRDLARTAVAVSLGRCPPQVSVCRPLASSAWRSHTPREEGLLAAAGPVALAAATAPAAVAAAATGPGGPPDQVLALLTGAALVLVTASLLPALPADGGRLVRAAAWRLSGSRVTGTRAARRAGRASAGLVVLVALSALTAGDAVATATALAVGGPLAVVLWRGRVRPVRTGGAPGRPRAADVALAVCLAVAATALLRAYVVRTFSVTSTSMRETLRPGDHVLADRVTYRLREVRRGDLVVLRRPAGARGSSEDLVKRVVGLPGERLAARDGTVSVDGRPLLEPYAGRDCAAARKSLPAVVIPAGHLYVLGDDRCGSLDSRAFGPVDAAVVEGRLLGIVWPPGRTGRL